MRLFFFSHYFNKFTTFLHSEIFFPVHLKSLSVFHYIGERTMKTRHANKYNETRDNTQQMLCSLGHHTQTALDYTINY